LCQDAGESKLAPIAIDLALVLFESVAVVTSEFDHLGTLIDGVYRGIGDTSMFSSDFSTDKGLTEQPAAEIMVEDDDDVTDVAIMWWAADILDVLGHYAFDGAPQVKIAKLCINKLTSGFKACQASHVLKDTKAALDCWADAWKASQDMQQSATAGALSTIPGNNGFQSLIERITQAPAKQRIMQFITNAVTSDKESLAIIEEKQALFPPGVDAVLQGAEVLSNLAGVHANVDAGKPAGGLLEVTFVLEKAWHLKGSAPDLYRSNHDLAASHVNAVTRDWATQCMHLTSNIKQVNKVQDLLTEFESKLDAAIAARNFEECVFEGRLLVGLRPAGSGHHECGCPLPDYNDVHRGGHWPCAICVHTGQGRAHWRARVATAL